MSRGSPSPARAYDERRGRGAPPRGTEPNLHQWGHDPRGAQCACGPASEHRARVAQWNRASASGLGALASQPRFLGALDWYSDAYGIRAPNTCRARQYKCSIWALRPASARSTPVGRARTFVLFATGDACDHRAAERSARDPLGALADTWPEKRARCATMQVQRRAPTTPARDFGNRARWTPAIPYERDTMPRR